MNPFRLAGDLFHLLAIIVLLVKIWQSRSCSGKRVGILSELLKTILSYHRYIGKESSAIRNGVYHSIFGSLH